MTTSIRVPAPTRRSPRTEYPTVLADRLAEQAGHPARRGAGGDPPGLGDDHACPRPARRRPAAPAWSCRSRAVPGRPPYAWCAAPRSAPPDRRRPAARAGRRAAGAAGRARVKCAATPPRSGGRGSPVPDVVLTARTRRATCDGTSVTSRRGSWSLLATRQVLVHWVGAPGPHSRGRRRDEDSMRLAPRPRTALVVFALYLLVFYGVWQLTGVAYNDVGDSARTIAKWYVAPLAAGALVLAMLVHGFWDFASFIGDGRRRCRAPRPVQQRRPGPVPGPRPAASREGRADPAGRCRRPRGRPSRGDLRAPGQEAGRCAGSLKTVTGRSWRTPSIVMSTSSL